VVNVAQQGIVSPRHDMTCVSMGVVWAFTMHRRITELFHPCARDTDQRSAMLACAPPTPVSNEEEGGGVRSRPGAARTILLSHIISARPSKQPLMVRTFLKVYMELGFYSLFLQEQIKDIIIGSL
jgi:hypothetical protein